MSDRTASKGGQLALDLPLQADYRSESFVVSEANASALALVNRWPDWRQGHLILVGPSSSGKTHLAAMWTERSHAIQLDRCRISDELKGLPAGVSVLIEDIHDGLDEDGLFHLLNRAASEDGTTVLITARGQLDTWPVCLPDLYSRLRAAETAVLREPDDALLRLVLEKLFRDRRTPLGHGLVNYLLPRMERSVEFAQRLVHALDREALSRQSAVSRQMAAEVLDTLMAPDSDNLDQDHEKNE